MLRPLVQQGNRLQVTQAIPPNMVGDFSRRRASPRSTVNRSSSGRRGYALIRLPGAPSRKAAATSLPFEGAH
jgi:hypothetical protein